MSKFPSQEMDRFNLRLPEGMREAIAERAKENGRSMNSEIIDMINNSLYLPSVGQDAIDTMLEMGKSDRIHELDDADRAQVETLLLQIAEKINKKNEQNVKNLSQIIDLINRIKKPT